MRESKSIDFLDRDDVLNDDGEIPELHECEAVRRVATQQMLDQNAYGRQRRAD
ncbi:hypothetical protein [Halolamina sp.]|uniref:hypothetical protein n=1 Tax=Halolamina sp. TaxID=1940283 RepID=UPI0012FD640A